MYSKIYDHVKQEFSQPADSKTSLAKCPHSPVL